MISGRREMPFWLNLVGYQIAWFATVVSAARGFSWLGVTAAALFTAANLVWSAQRSLDLKLISMAVALGVLSDGGLARLNLVEFASPSPAIPSSGAPLWIVTLWMAFAVTLNRSLAWLQQRPMFAVAFGAIGGPLAYGAAAKGWGSVRFEPPSWRAEVWLAISWATSMYLFGRVVRLGGSAQR